MNCKKCGKGIFKYTNAFHKMCMKCNMERLDAGKEPKVYKYIEKDLKSIKSKENRLNRDVLVGRVSSSGGNLILDEVFYEKCFNLSNHRCEECGKELPDEFRDTNGKIIMRSRYSHIVAKSIAPEIRHNVENINHLCFKHHFQWDHGDKKNMKIYGENRKKFPQYLK